MAQIGIITEQNDLGLGFDIVKNPKDQQIAQEACNTNKDNTKKDPEKK